MNELDLDDIEARLEQARADAWDEGYRRGRSDHCGYYPSAEECNVSSDNPHRRNKGAA